ncbi:ferredoxin [Treponema primitia ZAS-2]|uniref:Ferredoxin n=1 Tax=Treponema primitia (strain ATCC BAA-887 / DSM 12427 / ZAS-2) TaxID=545694 RepID=F5YPE8_TREPZ|nr:ASKHA domain-containing protein [Treponema primitia]AEF84592.1 ferredoxin [Treponema primitia ZAS-2]
MNTNNSVAPLITVVSGDTEQTIRFDIQKDDNLLKSLQVGGLYVPAICGGRGTCGKCKVKVTRGNLEPSQADRDYFSESDINDGWRLGCNARPGEDLRIIIPKSDEQSFESVISFGTGETEESATGPAAQTEKIALQRSATSFAHQLAGNQDKYLSLHSLTQIALCADMAAAKDAAPVGSEEAIREPAVYLYRDKGAIVSVQSGPEPVYGIGIDIGTTTIAIALVDLVTGRIRDRFSTVNKQRAFGADVISRMQRASKGDLSLLTGSVRKQISVGIETLLATNTIRARDVCKVAVAGNTTMMHLLLGLSCATLGQFPFTPVTLNFVFCSFPELFEGDLSCQVAILPGISTYVGADITAGIYFSNMYKSREPELLMDIGTNGEMALMVSGKLLCTATAAGPAFEGGNIQWGTGSVPGAISSVVWQNGQFELKTIGNRPPGGICGSGVVDLVNEGLKSSLIEPSGRFDKSVPKTGIFLAKTVDGQDINFCQKDVRELQLAKSAVRSGVDALIRHAGLSYGDIKNLFVAGGFGYNLNFSSGAGIGLIPPELQPKVRLIGNSALGGTVRYLLEGDSEETLNAIVGLSEEYSLPEDSYFNEMFIENINFE